MSSLDMIERSEIKPFGYTELWDKDGRPTKGARQMVAQATKKQREPAVKTYEPVFDKLVVSVIQASNETASGIQLPDSAVDKFVTMRALVIAKGPDCKSAVKVGDVVLLPGGQMEIVIHREQRTLVVAENQIWGIEIKE